MGKEQQRKIKCPCLGLGRERATVLWQDQIRWVWWPLRDNRTDLKCLLLRQPAVSSEITALPGSSLSLVPRAFPSDQGGVAVKSSPHQTNCLDPGLRTPSASASVAQHLEKRTAGCEREGRRSLEISAPSYLGGVIPTVLTLNAFRIEKSSSQGSTVCFSQKFSRKIVTVFLF